MKELLTEKLYDIAGVPKEMFDNNICLQKPSIISKRFELKVSDMDDSIRKCTTGYADTIYNVYIYQNYVHKHMSIRKYKKYAKKHNVINYRYIIKLIKAKKDFNGIASQLPFDIVKNRY